MAATVRARDGDALYPSTHPAHSAKLPSDDKQLGTLLVTSVRTKQLHNYTCAIISNYYSTKSSNLNPQTLTGLYIEYSNSLTFQVVQFKFLKNFELTCTLVHA
jgi:hypothetical protein